MSLTLEIRAPAGERDAVAAHNVLSMVFGTLPPEQEQARAAEAWLARLAAWGRLVPSSVRAAFRGAVCLGSYQIDERELWLGGAPVRVGCIGAVATHPEHRNQGVASALMRDAEALARQRGLGLLLLHGIGGFYHRFGYTNVADLVTHRIALADVDALPAGGCGVRPAAAEDAEALRALYERHQGCFVRSPELQRALLQQRGPARAPALALDQRGAPCGYLLPPEDDTPELVAEVGADTWEAAAALLRHHAQHLRAAGGQTGALVWSAGGRSTTSLLLADGIPLETVRRSIPNAEWMGRVASPHHLFAALLPAWQAHAHEHPAALRWDVGDERVDVCRQQGQLRLAQAPGDAPTIRLSQQVFARVLLGYRPPAWAARQPGQEIPPALLPLLERLVAHNHLFVPRSDEF